MAVKDQIVKEESNKKFNKLIDAAKKKYILAIEKQAKKDFKESGIKIPKKLIDSGYIRTTTGIYLKYKGSSDYGYESVYNPQPVKANSSGIEITMTEELIKLKKALKKLHSEKSKFQEELRQVLNSYTTDKKLLAAVPELQSYFMGGVMVTTLVPVETVNKVRESLKANKKSK